jgi:hypothetical protein
MQLLGQVGIIEKKQTAMKKPLTNVSVVRLHLSHYHFLTIRTAGRYLSSHIITQARSLNDPYSCTSSRCRMRWSQAAETASSTCARSQTRLWCREGKNLSFMFSIKHGTPTWQRSPPRVAYLPFWQRELTRVRTGTFNRLIRTFKHIQECETLYIQLLTRLGFDGLFDICEAAFDLLNFRSYPLTPDRFLDTLSIALLFE